MTLPALPIPTLEETAERYLLWVRPLLEDGDYQQTQHIVQRFIHTEGPQLQRDLQQFARQQEAVGKSWLSDAWLDGYLTVRQSLPLSTSGAFRLDLNLPGQPLTRLAYFVVALAKQSADYLNGQLPDNISPRGEPLDMRQWLSLRGIGRIPQKHCDRYELAPMDKQPRVIIVFWQGQAYALPILDKEHRVYSVATVLSMLQWVTQQNPKADNITALSLAPAEQAATLLADLCQSAVNRDNFQLLAHSLFHVHLTPKAFMDDTNALRELTFLANEKLWAYKPLTLCANLQNNDCFAHLEHSSYDAGALQSMFARCEAIAQQLTFAEPATTDKLQPNELHWQLSQAQQTRLAEVQQAYSEKAKHYQVSIATTPIETQLIPEKTSLDSLMQLLMQYAQLKAFDEIRNTYEAVDVSHFQAGRTECIRPVSSESVAFVRALAAGKATWADFNLAHQEHKNRIKACKRGHGVNRHLLGLQLMAQRRGSQVALFSDKAYTALTTDFLSTSSLGDRHLIGDFAFSPTAPGGIGVSYFLTDKPNGFLYCISYHQQQTDAVKRFINGLQEGSEQLMAFFANNPPKA